MIPAWALAAIGVLALTCFAGAVILVAYAVWVMLRG